MSIDLIGRYGEFNLFEYEGNYYALSVSSHEDSAPELIAEKKAISASSEKELKKILDHNNKWADSRGMYGLEVASQSKILRANSFNMIDTVEIKFDDPKVVILNGQAYLIDEKDYQSISSKRGVEETLDEKFINAISVGATPELIFEYKKHNIVEFDKIYYGIPLSAGPLDLQVINPVFIKGIYYGDTIKEVMNSIDGENLEDLQVAQAKNTSIKFYAEPTLLVSSDTTNYVGFKNMVYAIPQDLGPIDLASVNLAAENRIKAGDTLDELLIDNKNSDNKEDEDISIDLVDSAINRKTNEFSAKQKLIEVFYERNLFEFENTFFAIPINRGYIDLETEDYFSMPDVLYDVSLEGLKEAVRESLQANLVD